MSAVTATSNTSPVTEPLQADVKASAPSAAQEADRVPRRELIEVLEQLDHTLQETIASHDLTNRRIDR